MAPELELPADFAAMIESQAEVHGLSVEAFLRLLLEEREAISGRKVQTLARVGGHSPFQHTPSIR